MSGGSFDATWLACREPVDHRSRSRVLAAKFLDACAGAGPVVDLGAGTGSNLRYLRALDGGRDRAWRLVDRDARLLVRAGPAGGGVEAVCLDVADPRDVPLDDAAGLTAAALLDLVSTDWLRTLARRCIGLPVLFALSVDGRIDVAPQDPDDPTVMAGFHRDQERDKGLGAALGSAAPARAAALFGEAGHLVETARSDWALGAGDATLIAPYLTDLAAAARRATPQARGTIDAWLERRMAQTDRGALRITVGHVDLLALPA